VETSLQGNKLTVLYNELPLAPKSLHVLCGELLTRVMFCYNYQEEVCLNSQFNIRQENGLGYPLWSDAITFQHLQMHGRSLPLRCEINLANKRLCSLYLDLAANCSCALCTWTWTQLPTVTLCTANSSIPGPSCQQFPCTLYLEVVIHVGNEEGCVGDGCVRQCFQIKGLRLVQFLLEHLEVAILQGTQQQTLSEESGQHEGEGLALAGRHRITSSS